MFKSYFTRWQDGHMQEVIRGASSALVIRVIGTFIGFLVNILVARMLSADGAGIYFLTLSVVAIAATIGRLGFDNTLVRFIAFHASHNEWDEVRYVHRKVIVVVALSSMLVAAVLFLGARWLADSMFGKNSMEIPLMLAAAAVMPMAFVMIQAESLRGLKSISSSQWIKTVFISLGTLVLLYPLTYLWGANGAVGAYFIAVCLTAIASWLLWRYSMHSKSGREADGLVTISLKKLFHSSWPLFGATLAGIVIQQAATVLLGVLGNTGDVGIFSIANRVSNLLLFPLMAITSILAPKFAAMHRFGQQKELAKLVRRTSTMLTGFAVPAVIVVFAMAGWIMKIFGHEFIGGVWPLRWLLLGVVINVSTGAMGELLIMTGNEKLTRNLNVMAALVIILLCFILIPLYGSVGAAIAVSTGYSLLNLIMLIMVKRYLGFWPVGLK